MWKAKNPAPPPLTRHDRITIAPPPAPPFHPQAAGRKGHGVGTASDFGAICESSYILNAAAGGLGSE
jgi:hypothetical protein